MNRSEVTDITYFAPPPPSSPYRYHKQHNTEMYSSPSAPTEASTPSAPTEASPACLGSEQSSLIEVDSDVKDASVMEQPLKRCANPETNT